MTKLVLKDRYKLILFYLVTILYSLFLRQFL